MPDREESANVIVRAERAGAEPLHAPCYARLRQWLATLAFRVEPAYQRRGIGERLVRYAPA